MMSNGFEKIRTVVFDLLIMLDRHTGQKIADALLRVEFLFCD